MERDPDAERPGDRAPEPPARAVTPGPTAAAPSPPPAEGVEVLDAPELPDAEIIDLRRPTSTELVPVPRPEPEPEVVRPARFDTDRRSDVDRWGRSERIREMTRVLYEPMYRYWFRVSWEGFEHLPREGGALLVSNHAGAIPSDAPAIMHGIERDLGRPVYGLAENLFRRLPGIGTMWSRVGGVTANPDNAYRLLHDDRELVLVFPEGTKGTGKLYRERYQLARFGRGGFVEIAMRAGVPIIPIAVVGAEESMPILWKSKRLARLTGIPYFPVTANMLAFGPLGAVAYLPAKFKIRVLPPIRFDEEPDQERYSRSRVMDATERVRREIQDALYDMLRSRQSVWFG